MERKDKQLQKLFADYTEQIKPDVSVLTKAKSHMLEQQAIKAKRGKMLKRLIPSLSCVVLALFIASFVFGLWKIPAGNGNQGDVGQDLVSSPQSNSVNYTDVNLKQTSITYASANSLIDISWMQEYEIINESYKAYYLKDSNLLAFIRAQIAFSVDGTRVDVDLIIETDAGSYTKLSAFRQISTTTTVDDATINAEQTLLSGEYVTNAYFIKTNYKYYINTTSSNQNNYEEIISSILNK